MKKTLTISIAISILCSIAHSNPVRQKYSGIYQGWGGGEILLASVTRYGRVLAISNEGNFNDRANPYKSYITDAGNFRGKTPTGVNLWGKAKWENGSLRIKGTIRDSSGMTARFNVKRNRK
ncbi:MAG: hypothetical protein AB8D78_08605 [Akkermansiaceae bacterium]